MKSHGKRTLYWFVLGSLAFFVMSFSSPECSKSSTEPVAPHPDLEGQSGFRCQASCWVEFVSGRVEENKRFRTAKKTCNGDADCLAKEQAAHDQIVAKLIDDRDKCFKACDHEQGRARGGQ